MRSKEVGFFLLITWFIDQSNYILKDIMYYNLKVITAADSC